MQHKIHYVGYFDTPENSAEGRTAPPAAVTKMSYIAQAISHVGFSVRIISRSGTSLNRSFSGKRVNLYNGVNLQLLRTIGGSGIGRRICNRLIMDIQLLYTLLSIPKEETVIVYHSLGYSRMISLVKKLKKIRLVLEVEEIYSDVTGNNATRKKELKLFQQADAFIFPSELLDQKININQKPSVIIYGTYQVEPDLKIRMFSEQRPFQRHILYAGTLDPRKGGAQLAAATGNTLREWGIHIIGFGSDREVSDIKAFARTISERNHVSVTYDGLFRGEQYIQYLQSCDVGLSTQNPDAAFNDTSFPSKVLSYLANGLRVVSIRIPVLEASAISDLLYYYDDNNPEAIAQAISKIDFNDDYDSRSVVRELDRQFKANIKKLLEREENA